ncbi:unnamed protein product [Aphanomyces euteiches]|uniref:Uncharacterized protein n=1 Tax=Aphanomyces euteiches TaxID=100861 RepID=A0A6G0WIJ0_9STRA|nr:hypothetical protein Ae201684_014789 [Aphanomyces euteiches]KAH9072604.1 hypothetical protein Ae201684P_015679 [Aphanomyces euteiches]KAH9142575.1 hypothetical protein AeRB84_013345 [Aphanomyces euteiches]
MHYVGMRGSTRFQLETLPTGGTAITVPVVCHQRRVITWIVVHFLLIAIVPVIAHFTDHRWVVLFFAIPIGFELWAFGSWLLWELRGLERFVISPTTWTYERKYRGLATTDTQSFDLHTAGKLQVDAPAVRFGFEGHMRFGVAFKDEVEIIEFLDQIAPLLPQNVTYSPPTNADVDPPHLGMSPIVEESEV